MWNQARNKHNINSAQTRRRKGDKRISGKVEFQNTKIKNKNEKENCSPSKQKGSQSDFDIEKHRNRN